MEKPSLSMEPTYLPRGPDGDTRLSRVSSDSAIPRRRVRDRFKGLSIDIKRRPTPIVEGEVVLTQDIATDNDTTPTSSPTKQSNDLIRNALGRRGSGGSQPASGTATPNTSKPTAGALAALGLGAARIGQPAVSGKSTPAASGRSTPQPPPAAAAVAPPAPAPAPASAPAPAQSQPPTAVAPPAAAAAAAAAAPNPPNIQTTSAAPTEAGAVPTINTPIAPTPIVSSAPQVQIADGPIHPSNTTTNDPNPPPILHKPVPDRSRLIPSRPLGVVSSGASTPQTGSERPSREPSPFFAARKSREEHRARARSPEIGALRKDSIVSAGDSESESTGRGRYRPRSSAYESPDESGNEADDNEDSHTEDDDFDSGVYDDDDEELWDDDHFFDEETEKNTEANAIYLDDECMDADGAKRINFDVYGEETEQDVLGEGPNVVLAPEPLFALPDAKSRKSQRSGLEVITSRPMYARDRCTINIVQGDPDGMLDESGKRMRRYVVLSDLSEESRYAVQWAVGTVARDGDEIFLISVMEDESKVDPKRWTGKDQNQKIKVQKEVS